MPFFILSRAYACVCVKMFQPYNLLRPINNKKNRSFNLNANGTFAILHEQQQQQQRRAPKCMHAVRARFFHSAQRPLFEMCHTCFLSPYNTFSSFFFGTGTKGNDRVRIFGPIFLHFKMVKSLGLRNSSLHTFFVGRVRVCLSTLLCSALLLINDPFFNAFFPQ